MHSLFYWLWMGCTQLDDVVQQHQEVHVQLLTLREAYQKASSLYDEGLYPKAVQQFRELQLQYPNSRAVLEGLLLSELHDEESHKAGYTRIQEYMSSHPGDVDFRLIQAKFHLKMGDFTKARDDLEILLFNQSIHPWVLAQDPFLRHHRDGIDSEKLPFGLIRLLEIELPTAAVVGDAIDIRVSFLHLSSCRPHIPPFDIGLDVVPKKLNVYQETVDSTVVKTTFVQSLINSSAAKSQPTAIQIRCGSASMDVTLPSVDVIDLISTPSTPKQSTLVFPDIESLEQGDSGIPWTVYLNHVEAKRGLWEPPAGD